MKPIQHILRLGIACLALTFAPIHAQADYAQREDAAAFANEIAARNQLDAAQILSALSRANYDPRVIKLIKPPETRIARSWQRYRSRFLDHLHVVAGLAAWSQYENELLRAEKQYGVPPEIILGILGVETIYGRNTGNFETLSALATLAFDYPPRADLFRGELEALFLLAKDQKREPASYTGSYAGAIGWPQFLPSSIRRYAVDFDGDGKIDFESNAVDAIGSVANYLHVHGWRPDEPVAEKAWLTPEANPEPLIAAGIEPTLTLEQLAAAGIFPIAKSQPANTSETTLVDLETPDKPTEYWLGYRNFYVITRYNRSSFYAMSVFQLAQALRTAHDTGHYDVPPPANTAAKAKRTAAKTKKAAPHSKPVGTNPRKAVRRKS
ncbi:MAG: lytic murein transglycosylase B [Azoarcus sp.]|jgi:membrane-bound lytic murein transglycosylase B|nr:lytic murein transglycosylase B [Azoarcus sp.]